METQVITTKICSKCEIEKSIDDFWHSRYSRHSDGLQSRCKDCCRLSGKIWTEQNKNLLNERRRNDTVREKALLRHIRNQLNKFDIAPEDYQFLLSKGCMICGCKNNTHRHRLHIDHDHTTGKFRGILCTNCNTAIGLMCDDPKRLKIAIKYLGGK